MTDAEFYDEIMDNPNAPTVPNTTKFDPAYLRDAATRLRAGIESGEITIDPQYAEDGIDFAYALSSTAGMIEFEQKRKR